MQLSLLVHHNCNFCVKFGPDIVTDDLILIIVTNTHYLLYYLFVLMYER